MGGLNVEKGLAGLALGAVAGYGEGMAQQGAQKRALALKMLESQIKTSGRIAVETRKHGYKLDEQRQASNLRIKEAKAKKPDTKGLFQGLGPILREAREYSTITDEDGNKRLDEGRFTSYLRSAGLGKMADTLSRQAATGQGPFDPRLFEEAGKRAEAEAEERDPFGPNFLRPDATKEAYGPGGEQGFITRRTSEIYDQLGGRGGGAPREETPLTGPETREAGSRILSVDEVRSLGREGLKPGTRARGTDGQIYAWDGNQFQPEGQVPSDKDPLAGVPEVEKRAREKARSEPLTETSVAEKSTIASTETPADRRFTPAKGQEQVAAAEKRRREIQAKPDDELVKMIRKDLMEGISLIDATVTWADQLGDGARASRLVRQAKQKARGG